jgi:hypothetical protein
MMTSTTQRRTHPAPRRLTTVAVVAPAGHADVLDAIVGASEFDVVLIDSLEHAYSHIKRAAPQAVIMCVDVDDPRCFQVMSMLKLDSETSAIPVVTHFMPPQSASVSDGGDTFAEAPAEPAPLVLN